MDRADEIQQLLEVDIKHPACREGIAVVLKILRLRREHYRDLWERGDTENLLTLGKAKECRELIDTLSGE